jgi:hypothetical protein
MTVQIPETPSVETVEEVPTEVTPVETPSTDIQTFNAPSASCETAFEPGVITSSIREFIGTPSCGYEYLEYALAGGVMIILFAFVASFFMGFSKLLGAK